VDVSHAAGDCLLFHLSENTLASIHHLNLGLVKSQVVVHTRGQSRLREEGAEGIKRKGDVCWRDIEYRFCPDVGTLNQSTTYQPNGTK
jgi:hypothetical protein